MSTSTSSGMSARILHKRESTSIYPPIPTFVQAFDAILGGGIKPGVITEIVGDSGLGKTTLCYQLCLDVQIPKILQGLDSEAIFIDNENSFVTNRIREMAKAFVTHCNYILPKNHRLISEQSLLNRIHVLKCRNLSEFVKVCLSLESFIACNGKIKLIAIDSVAFPFYQQDDGFYDRSKPLYALGEILRVLADKYGLAVVVTNNVTTRFDGCGNDYFVPFLGESWSHVPNQRISLTWSWSKHTRRRVAEIIKSPYVPPSCVNYRVAGVGIRD